MWMKWFRQSEWRDEPSKRWFTKEILNWVRKFFEGDDEEKSPTFPTLLQSSLLTLWLLHCIILLQWGWNWTAEFIIQSKSCDFCTTELHSVHPLKNADFFSSFFHLHFFQSIGFWYSVSTLNSEWKQWRWEDLFFFFISTLHPLTLCSFLILFEFSWFLTVYFIISAHSMSFHFLNQFFYGLEVPIRFHSSF